MSKKYLISFFSAALITYMVILGINVKIDSACVLGCEGVISEAAKAIKQGHSVSGLQNFDHRMFHKLLINLSEETPEMIVLGSSRSMQLSSSFFHLPSQKFFNHSLSATFLEDIIGVLSIYDHRGVFPKRVLIAVDPWIFNRVDPHSNWKTLAEEYYALKKKLQKQEEGRSWLGSDRFFGKLKTLSSFNYLKINLTLNEKVGKLLLDQSPETNAMDIINTDGSWTIPISTRTQDKSKTLKDLESYQSYLKNYDQISDLDLFEKLITYLQSHQVQVEFFLPPYHPRGYELVKEDKVFRIILEVEGELRKLAERNKVKVYGSYDPNPLELQDRDFYDGIHAYGTSVRKLFPGN